MAKQHKKNKKQARYFSEKKNVYFTVPIIITNNNVQSIVPKLIVI